MKKIVFLLLTAFAVASCNDDCDHNINSNGGGDEGGDFTYEYLSSGTGSWYEEAENEEFRPTANGKFYDKYCNLKRAAETEGTYEISEKGTRMTQTYKFMGQNQFADWKISNVKEFSFAMSSEQVAAHTYEKIVEVYTLAVGQTQKINFATEYPSYSIKSFNSSNEHIASVSSDGTITAIGEKGTAYVKITHDQGNVWVKVIVGDNYADLWYDYSNLLDYTYTQMRSLLGEPDQVSTEYGSYSYTTPLHDVINYFNIFINERTQTVEQIDLYLKEGVPSTQIISYMDAHYYTLGESGGTKFYHTSPTYEESRAIFAYVKSSNTVMIVPAEGFLDLWKDFTPLFGQESDNIKKEMTNNGFTYLMTDNSYSLDGSDYYSIPDNDYATMVGFVFNKDKKMCEYWIYLDTKSDASTAYGFLNNKYSLSESESNTSSGAYIFYNSDKSIKITFSLEGYVKYENVGMEGPTKPSGLWPDYAASLGKTHDEIVSEYGSPVMDDDSGIWYILANEYVNYLIFRADASTGKMKYVSLILNDAVETKTVTDYLGSLYTVYERGTASDGSQYAWTNGPSMAESTFGIVYFPSDKHVLYQSLGSSNAAARQVQFNISNAPRIDKNLNTNIHNPFAKQQKRMSMKSNSTNWYSPLLKNFSVKQ